MRITDSEIPYIIVVIMAGWIIMAEVVIKVLRLIHKALKRAAGE